MLTITKAPTPTADPQDDVAPTIPARTTRPPRRLGPVAFMAAGAASIVAAGTLVVQILTGAPTTASPQAGAAAPAHTDVGISDNTYEPGHSSTWHTHPGVHSVVVLEGTLTVYDETCTKQDVGPGGSYLGGREAHLVRNETDTPVRLVVTHAFTQASALDHAGAAPAPRGCAAR